MANKAAQSPWLHNRRALFVRAGIGFVLSYAFLSRAIDTGSYWQYLGAIVFLALSVKLFTRALKK